MLLKFLLTSVVLVLTILSSSAASATVNPQLAICDALPQRLGPDEVARLKRLLVNSFPVRHFDVLSRVSIVEVADDDRLGPELATTLGRAAVSTIMIPAKFLPRQCRMLLLQTYHLSGTAADAGDVGRQAIDCIRGGGKRASCLDTSVAAYLSRHGPVDLTEDATNDVTIQQFLTTAPWSAVHFLIAHEAAHIVADAGAVDSANSELEADLVAIQSVVSDGVLPIALLSGVATTSLIDTAVVADIHGTSSCRATRLQGLTERLLPKVLLLMIALVEPSKFDVARSPRAIASPRLLMSMAKNCEGYDDARFTRMDGDLDDLVRRAEAYVRMPRGRPAALTFGQSLATFTPRSPEGIKWKAMLLFMSSGVAGFRGLPTPADVRIFFTSIEPLYAAADVTTLPPTSFAAIQSYRAMAWYFTRPVGSAVIANSRGLTARFDAIQRYLPLDVDMMRIAKGAAEQGDVSAFGMIMMILSYTSAKVVAQGCGDADRIMAPLATLNPAAVAKGRVAACEELRASTIASQAAMFGWTTD